VGPELPPYEPRHVRFRKRLTVAGWTLKLYGVSVREEAISDDLAASAVDVAATVLPQPPLTGGRYGVGFVIAHESVSTSYVLVCWWDERNEVHQRIFSAPASHPSELAPHDSSAIGCVWELSVTDFERRAWIEHVLEPGGTPDVTTYLRQELNTDV
jgi:hypothetical protein